MQKYMRWLILSCTAVITYISATTTSVLAGAWPQPDGTTLIIVSTSYSLAHQQFDPAGNTASRGRFRKIETQLYVEHGITRRITAIGKIIRSTHQTETLGQRFTDGAFRTVELGARAYIVTWEDTLYSIDALAIRHTASEGDDPAASHAGDMDYEVGITTGAADSILGLDSFSETRIAYRYRPGIRPAEARVDVTMGVNFGDAWLAMLKSSSINSIGRTPSPLGHYWSSKGEFSVVHTLEPGFSIEVAAFRTFLGRNVLRETGGKLAFWYRF